jgi:hypothetical protein
MKTTSLLFACLLLGDGVSAEQVELVVGEEISAAGQAQLRRLPVMGSGGEILSRRPDPSVFIDRTEYFEESKGLVIAIELTRDPLRKDGKAILTKIYFSNDGERVSTKEKESWKWLDAKNVVIDPETWTASIKRNGEAAP